MGNVDIIFPIIHVMHCVNTPTSYLVVQGNRTTPSYVAFTRTERLVGDAAKNQASALYLAVCLMIGSNQNMAHACTGGNESLQHRFRCQAFDWSEVQRQNYSRRHEALALPGQPYFLSSHQMLCATLHADWL